MSLSVVAQRRLYPLTVYAFRVTVGDKALQFSEVAGLGREYQTLTYRHGLSAWEGEGIVKFKVDHYLPITLKKGLVPGDTAKWLYAWLEGAEKSALQISLCDMVAGATPTADPEPQARVTWHLRKALLVRIEAPTLQAQGNEVAIETLTLMASGIAIEHH